MISDASFENSGIRTWLVCRNASFDVVTGIRTSFSEQQLQSKLYVPRRIRLAGNNAKVRATQGSARGREHHGVGQVERLGAELKLESFGQMEVLEQREIQIPR